MKDAAADFGMWCMSIPFKLCAEAKDVASRDWADEDGTDEYVPHELKLKSYDMDVKWCCKGERGSANAALSSFLSYLTGRDGGGAVLSMYCDYTGIGRRCVRFVKLSDDAELVRDDDGDVLVVTTTMRVTDPVTDVVLWKR